MGQTMISPGLFQKIECVDDHKIIIKDNVRIGSHDPFFLSNYSSGIVSAHTNVDSRQ